MVPSLKDLAKDTLIRNILFCEEPNPLLQHCFTSNDHLDFESQFVYDGLLLNIDDSSYLPTTVSSLLLSGILELCPNLCPEWAILTLIHPESQILTLTNLSFLNSDGLQLFPLLHKLFVRCQQIKSIQFNMVEIMPDFFCRYVKPRAVEYTEICFSQCFNVKDSDIKLLLENCPNLSSLNVSACLITDEAFTDVNLKRHRCQDCGILGNKRLPLSVLNLSECTKLTTKSIRALVDLCGPSLRSLNIGSCTHIYATALWYLCGIFKGKGEFLKGNFSLPEDITCGCDEADPVEQRVHQNAINACTTLDIASDPNISGPESEESNFPSTSTHGMSQLDDIVSDNVLQQQMSSLDITDATLSSVFFDLQRETDPSEQSKLHELFPTIQSVFNGLHDLCDEQCSMLEYFLQCTSTDDDEIPPSLENGNELSDDFVDPTAASQFSTLNECKEELYSHYDVIKSNSKNAYDDLIKIIRLKFNDVGISTHTSFQTLTKSIILDCTKILTILDHVCLIVYNILEQSVDNVSNICTQNNTYHLDNTSSLSDHSSECAIFDAIPSMRKKIVYFVLLLGKTTKEIKLNELLRIRLRDSMELEAIQREQLEKLNAMNADIIALQDIHDRQLNIIHDSLANALNHELEDAVDGEAAEVELVEPQEEAVNIELIEPPDQVIDLDDESSPELLELMQFEVSLLLLHSMYSHCPSCCPYAYRPQIQDLDISNIKYQSEEIAKVSLKSFVTINKGLKCLNISWSCVDNDTMDFIAKQCPDLKSLSLRQCELLTSPVLQSFSNHDLEKLDILGVSWIQDGGVLPYLRGTVSSLSSLCLAEAYITDTSLIHLAKHCKFKNLDLSWCDDVTDEGVAVIVSANSETLQYLSVRQCAIGLLTLSAISLCCNLIKLDVSTAVEFTDATWMPIALNMPHVEDLDVGWVGGITNKMLSVLLMHCSRLKRICLDGHKNITTQPFDRMLLCREDGSYIRSAQYVPVLKYISLQYCNDMDDMQLKKIVEGCRGSLVIRDYYGDELVL